MRRMKKVVAGLLCFSMLLNSNGMMALAATNDYSADDGIVQEEVIEENTEESSDITEETVTETTEESTLEESTTEESIVEESAEDNQQKEAPLINWMLLAEDYLTSDMEQSILVDMGDDTTVIKAAALTLKHVPSNQEYTQDLTSVENSTMTFKINPEYIKADGEYQVTAIEVTTDEDTYTIDFAEIGMDARFGVNEVVVTNPDVYFTEEPSNGPMDGVVINDAEGNPLSAEDIQAAVEAVSKDDSNMNSDSKKTSDGRLVIVLDPGHGGHDSGACANGVQEKVANLKIAQACKAYLDEMPDAVVYMTRNSDVYVGLEERTAYAASVHADIFISLHNNSAGAAATGSEVIYPNASYNANAHIVGHDVSQKILNALVALGFANRGIYTRDYSPAGGASSTSYYPDGSVADYYSVIRTSKLHGFPGIIVEHAFVSNAHDAAYLASDAYLKAMGEADGKAIAEYFGLYAIQGTTYQGLDYKDVYDYDYYLKHNPDVKNALGTNQKTIFKHFLFMGMKEGRQASAEFNPIYYKNRYPDLRGKFGNDLPQYYLHYIKYGKKEGRDGKTPCTNPFENGYVTEYNGVDYSAVYDYKYYISHYSPVAKKYTGDDVGAIKHFVTVAMPKGKQGNKTFNMQAYAYANADIRAAFKNNYTKYYLHYIANGKAEGRVCNGVDHFLNGQTVYKGKDYSAVYDLAYYASKYPSLEKEFGFDDAKYLEFFYNVGMKDGHCANPDFVLTFYKNRYVDLRNRFGTDNKKYYLHYINTGKKNNRDAHTYTTRVGKVTVYDGVDYKLVYDYDVYKKKSEKYLTGIAEDDTKVIEHFVNVGMPKGRKGNNTFDVKAYAYANADCRASFKNNLPKYYLHYVRLGNKQGRVCKGVTTFVGGKTVYKNVDYSAVYNLEYYVAKHPNYFKQFGFDDNLYLKNFVTKGMAKGQTGSKEFVLKYYKNRYADLRGLFKDDNAAYYMHYINYGKKEGRDAHTKCDERIGGITILNGIDYAAVYDYDFYVNKYPDLIKTFGDNEEMILRHFVTFGMNEGRRASKKFDVTSYRYKYPDLRKIYRGNLKGYYMHYINYGVKEGRVTTGCKTLQNPWTVYNGVDYSKTYDFWEFRKQNPAVAEQFGMDDYGQLEYYVMKISKLKPIATAPTTNVNQMVRYFKSRASYPAFYGNSDAKTIEQFAQIVYDESVAEGIDPAVTFCQVMKETGFLRFGGDVSITQYNFGGIGATGGGAPGLAFSSVRHGIRCQVQHLKAYATTASLNNPCVDPRFHLVRRGAAPYVEWLGIHENPYGTGWAGAYNYGYSIKNDFMLVMYRY